jgi:hypothetical protein
MQAVTPATLGDLQAQALIHADAHTRPAWRTLGIEVTRTASAYALHWRAPRAAQLVEIRYSAKRIVEWLGFDKSTRRYRHDPQQFVPYFAAEHVGGSARPATDHMEIPFSALACGAHCYFAMKYLASGEH